MEQVLETHAPVFQFHNNQSAATHNSQIITSFNGDLGAAISAQTNTL